MLTAILLMLGTGTTTLKLSLMERRRYAIASAALTASLPAVVMPWAVRTPEARIQVWTNDTGLLAGLCVILTIETFVVLALGLQLLKAHHGVRAIRLGPAIALFPSPALFVGIALAEVQCLTAISGMPFTRIALGIALVTAAGLIAIPVLMQRLFSSWLLRLELLVALMCGQIITSMFLAMLVGNGDAVPLPMPPDWRATAVLVMVVWTGVTAGYLRPRRKGSTWWGF